MIFYFQDVERLQMCFYSPNVCGAFLVVLVLVLCGIFLQLNLNRSNVTQILSWLVFILISILFIGIAMTFSRGAYLACFISLLFANFLLPSKKNIFLLLVFLLIISVSPKSMSRVITIKDTEDGSIRNRLHVWRGGCAIIAENWCKGIGGIPAAGHYYTRKYCPKEIHESYQTLVSDILTIGASYGVIILSLYLMITGFAIQISSVMAVKENFPFLLLLSCSLFSYLISGLFSTLYCFSELSCFAALIFLLIVFFIFRGFSLNVINWKQINWRIVPALTFTIIGAILLTGFYYIK